MLILPIKKKWFDMIKSGEKKEEYREMKPYYSSRIGNALCGLNFKYCREDFIKRCMNERIVDVVFRNGYSYESPTIFCKCKVRVGQGKEEWGAEPGEVYYILKIVKIL